MVKSQEVYAVQNRPGSRSSPWWAVHAGRRWLAPGWATFSPSLQQPHATKTGVSAASRAARLGSESALTGPQSAADLEALCFLPWCGQGQVHGLLLHRSLRCSPSDSCIFSALLALYRFPSHCRNRCYRAEVFPCVNPWADLLPWFLESRSLEQELEGLEFFWQGNSFLLDLEI